MKINSISGTNIASLYGDFKVDFRENPLSEYDIFAITGPTGSGKSTILDAMCLALFGMTPRLNKEKDGQSEYWLKDIGSQTLLKRDPRRMMSEGEKDCLASVNFTGNDGEDYRSEWKVKRTESRSEEYGAMKPATMRLFLMRPDGEEECHRKIEDLIGMDFNQFCKTVLLSQGAFQEFLKATDDEKASILEQLTGTEIYSRIGEAVRNAHTKADRDNDDIQKQIADIKKLLLTDDAIETYKSNNESLEKEIAESNDNLKKIVNKLNWIKANLAFQDADAEYHTASELNVAAEGRRTFLANLDSLHLNEENGIRHYLKELESANTRLREISVNQSKANSELKDLEDRHHDLESTMNDAIAERDRFEREDYKMRNDAISKAIELDAKIKPAEGAYISAKEAEKIANKAFKDTSDLISTLRSKLEVKKADEGKVNEWLAKHAPWKPVIDDFPSIISSATNYFADIARAETASEKKKTSDALQDNLNTSLTKAEDSQRKIAGLLPSDIARLRLGLKDGCPCPVCGSLEHPETSVGECLKEDSEMQSEALEKLRNEIADYNSRIIKAKSDSDGYQKTVEEEHNKADNEAALLSQYLTPCIDNWKTTVNLLDVLSITKNQWEENMKNQTNLNTEISGIKDQITENENKLPDLDLNLTNCIQTTKNRLDELERLRKDRKEILGDETIEDAKGKNAGALKAKYHSAEQCLNLYNDHLQKESSLRGSISTLKSDETTTRQSISDWNSSIDNWLESTNTDRSQDKKLNRETLTSILSSYSSDWMRAEQSSLDNLKSNVDAALKSKNRLKDVRDSILTPEEAPGSDTTQEQLNADYKDLDNQIKKKNDERAANIGKLQSDSENRQRNADNLKIAEEKAKTLSEWSVLNDIYGYREKTIQFRKIAQAYTLKTLVIHANEQLRKFSDRYQLIADPDATHINSLALMIIDGDNGNLIRTTTSLSGGEQFIVSLALALGLSSLSSSKMSVGSLFIDEGFGSLDSETLNTVMEVLEKMRTQGKRKIGIISHVEAINDRIKAQIRVVPEGGNGGHSKITIQG